MDSSCKRRSWEQATWQEWTPCFKNHLWRSTTRVRQSSVSGFWKRRDWRCGPIQRQSGRLAKQPFHIKLQLAIPQVLLWCHGSSVMKPKEALVIFRLKNFNDNLFATERKKDCFLFSRYTIKSLWLSGIGHSYSRTVPDCCYRRQLSYSWEHCIWRKFVTAGTITQGWLMAALHLTLAMGIDF